MDSPDLALGARRPYRRGFTLIELMVVLVITSVLAMIAIPSFIGQVRKSRRSEAITEVFRVSQAQERFRASNPSYNAVAAYNVGPNNYYSATVTLPVVVAARASEYTITATAINAMLGDTTCRTLQMQVIGGVITYSSTNAANVVNTAVVNNGCWNR